MPDLVAPQRLILFKIIEFVCVAPTAPLGYLVLGGLTFVHVDLIMVQESIVDLSIS